MIRDHYRLPPERGALADPDSKTGTGALFMQCFKRPPCLIDIVHNQGIGSWIGEQRLLQGMAQGHRQTQTTPGYTVDACHRSRIELPGQTRNRLIKLCPAELSHGRENGT